MKLGERIYYHRVKEGMTQKELAAGICSIPYLSKIENNNTEASEEIISMLFKKLGIEYSMNDEEFENKTLELINEWYKAIKSKNIEQEELYHHCKLNMSSITNPTIINQYTLVHIRYCLFKQEFSQSVKLINELNDVEKLFSEDQQYMFYHLKGVYYYFQNDLNRALELLIKSHQISKKINLLEKDPHVYYMLSLTYSRLFHISDAIYYAEVALDYYQRDFDYERMIDTRSILIINYIRLNQFDEALINLESSLRFAEKIKDDIRLGNIYHNFGYLYFQQSEDKKAIEYYFRALEYKSEETETFWNTVMYILKAYLNVNEHHHFNHWLNKGLEYAQKNKWEFIENKLKTIDSLYNIKSDHSREYLENKAIPYFRKNYTPDTLIEIYTKLGDYYYEFAKYKKSSDFYKCIITLSKV
ncbi:helix-turn-helix domain-containing protein [Chengkuizengella axinellae]|uniref:Helix-turn-helix transcriptional regulator n=1 Tax=Chengkuizengella axinellae TaxID=3064388 RepID=A0ABT9J4W4_9BACL|nr:helix-turn-helix transcriptional regulator [Chengkuizengella sp. 2205SS18-9]MDP5275984.1 helix-turn-helix transcriptional regulator [Chengkuizengella sp. 2205SS18-9]